MTRKSDRQSAFYAGSFNPLTIGHLDIIRRAVALFGHVVIGIGCNVGKPDSETRAQKCYRELAALFEGIDEVSVEIFDGLTAEQAKSSGCRCLVRGVRNVSDFEYENSMASTNREIAGIDTVVLCCDPKLSAVSSSMVRELAHFGYDTARYIADREKVLAAFGKNNS